MSSDTEAWSSLTPVLSVGRGRTGSTLLMALLATSDEIAFDRVFPFEGRHLLRVAEHCASYDESKPQSDLATPGFVNSALLRAKKITRRLIGHRRSVPQTYERPSGRTAPVHAYAAPNLLSDAPGREPYWQSCLRVNVGLCLGTIAANAASWGMRPRYYAEKAETWLADDLRAIGPARVLYRLRDPRDTWLSTQAFDKKRGFYGFDRGSNESKARYLDRFIAEQRRYLQRVVSVIETGEGSNSMVVRFEDLVLRTEAVAREIGGWLGVVLSDSAALRSLEPTFGAHSTSAGSEQSVGRWECQMARPMQDRFAAEIGGLLESVGYSAVSPASRG